MKLGSSVEIAEGVHQIWAVGARVTVIVEGDDVALVDTGSKGSVGPIISGLDSLGIAPERVGLIVLRRRTSLSSRLSHVCGIASRVTFSEWRNPTLAHPITSSARPATPLTVSSFSTTGKRTSKPPARSVGP